METDTEAYVIGTLLFTLVALFIYMMLRSTTKVKVNGDTEMDTRKQVYLSRKDKKKYVDMFTDWVEGAVLSKKMTRREARKVYLNASVAFDIPDLHPFPTAQEQLKAKIALKRKMNGHDKPPLIPGAAPVQELKPNNYKEIKQQKLKSFFKAKPIVNTP
jgi:hypothetical protein